MDAIEVKARTILRAEATLDGLRYVDSDELLAMLKGLPAAERAMSLTNHAGRSVGLGPKAAVELIAKLALWEGEDGTRYSSEA